LKNRDQLTKTATSTKVLTERYSQLQDKAKKLGGETKLTAEEQKEMQRIVSELAKVVPGAVTAVNKYGEALKLNKKLLEEYNRENAKVLEIDKKKAISAEIQLQKDLSESIKDKTNSLKNYKEVEGQGSITTEFVAEKEKELSLLKIEAILSKGRLKDLQGLTEAEREAVKVSEESTNAKVANSARTIQVIDDEIKAQEELVKGLSDKTGKEGRAIQSKIANLQKEREQIFSTAKAEKDKQENGLKNAKKVNDSIYQLSQFRYQNEINNNQKIIDSEKSTNEERINALLDIQQLQEAKSGETLQYELLKNALDKEGLENLSKQKIAIYRKDAEERIKSILAGKIATESLTNEEKLILEKFYADKKNLEEKSAADKQALIDSEVAKVQKQIDSDNQKANIEMNQALKAENDKFLALNNAENQNQKEREAAIEEHERRILEIKNIYAKKAIETSIAALKKELDENAKRPAQEQLSAEQIQAVRDKLAAAEVALGEVGVANYKKNSEEKVDIEKITAEQILQISSDLTSAISGFVNALFERKIANIDYEIRKNDEYYNAEIENAGDNQRKKDILTREAEKKRQELEKKKRIEQHKQAVYNKAVTIAEIGLKTAQAVMSAAAATAPTFWGVAIAAAIGALQLATAIATPIPKYKDGRKGGPAEWAVTGDGGRSEVITSGDGSNPILTPNKPTLTYLGKDDIVHKSYDDYKKYLRQSVVNDFPRQVSVAREYQERITNNKYDPELLAEMKRNTDAIKKGKPIIHNHGGNIDISHAIWASKNINWK